jgi:hypothetical protein
LIAHRRRALNKQFEPDTVLNMPATDKAVDNSKVNDGPH